MKNTIRYSSNNTIRVEKKGKMVAVTTATKTGNMTVFDKHIMKMR